MNAWLDAFPRDNTGKPLGKTRRHYLEKLLKDDAPLPYIAGTHLIQYLFEIGPLSGEKSGISYQEIAAWQSLTGIQLMPWEARMLRRLSVEYGNELAQAESVTRQPPWDGAECYRSVAIWRSVQIQESVREINGQ